MSKAKLLDEYRRMMSRLRAGGLSLWRGREDAEDALHDAFCRLWNARRGKEETLESAFCRNMDTRRKSMERHPTVCLGSELAASEPPPDELQETFRRVDEHLRRTLPPKQYEVMRLREIEGLSIQEIMQELGCSEAAVRMNLSRARQTIRQQFNNQRQ